LAGEWTLTPTAGVILLVVKAATGQAFRSNWKLQKPGWVWRAWAFALPALVSFLLLAFVPLRGG